MRPLAPAARRASRALLAVAAAALAGGCVDWNSPDPETDALVISERTWAEQGPPNYQYTIQRSCGTCPDVRRQRVTVTVRGDVVTERRYADTGAPVPASEAAYFPTVDGLFSELRTLLDNRPVSQNAAFNLAHGYPVTVFIDPTLSADDEMGWEITQWQELTP